LSRFNQTRLNGPNSTAATPSCPPGCKGRLEHLVAATAARLPAGATNGASLLTPMS
jgi:hypothetical protein